MGRAHEVRAASMAKTAAMKSAKYAKWGKEIFIAAKSGVPDPEMNQSLKNTIARAKKDQCPADVIKRAIDKAAGLKSGATKEKVYEGYGPGKVAMIVECLTDNDNRTYTEIRTAFAKCGGEIGSSVSYLFNRKAQFIFDGMTEDEAMEALMEGEADFEDMSTDEDGFVTILAESSAFESIKNALLAAKPELEFEECAVNMIPTQEVELDEDKAAKLKRLLGLLREYDDVSEIYFNCSNVSEEDDDEE